MKGFHFTIATLLIASFAHAEIITRTTPTEGFEKSNIQSQPRQQQEDKALKGDNHGFQKKPYQRRYRSKAVNEVIPREEYYLRD